MPEKGGARVSKGSLRVDYGITWTLPARLTGLALLESLSPVHLCRQDIIDAVEVTTECFTRAAARLFAITFLGNGDGQDKAVSGRGRRWKQD